jgi:hypothetical protein
MSSSIIKNGYFETAAYQKISQFLFNERYNYELSIKFMGIKEFALKPLTKGTIAELIRKVL